MPELSAPRSIQGLSGISKPGAVRRDNPPRLETPLSAEEARLMLRIQTHFNSLAKRSRRMRPAQDACVEPMKPPPENSGPEDIAIPQAFEELLVHVPVDARASADDGFDDTNDAGAGAVMPVWLAGRHQLTWRERAAIAFSWVITFSIVTAILSGAIIGLIGYGRAVSIAAAAAARVMELGRAIGFT